MASTDNDGYRLVPYRFSSNEANSDMCKLEKLTNLFPEMKAIIELELFKINNFQRMVDRLSIVFKPVNAVDNRDDTIHLFLGPYHLSVGPAVFGALSFKNISTALLASAKSQTSHEDTDQYHKRRHDGILRRFRRAVRKLILIKSLINQLRLASILTPYNQYELYTRGTYDLALSGHVHNSQSVFHEDSFTEQINNFRLRNNAQKRSPLLASKYVKINALLHLLSPTSNPPDNNTATQTLPDDFNNYTTNEKPFINSKSLSYSQHGRNIPLVTFPDDQAINHPSNHLLTPDYDSRRNNRYRSRRNSSVLSNESTTNSLPDLSAGDNFGTDMPSSTGLLPTSTIARESNKLNDLISLRPHVLSSQLITSQEDVFIHRISSILTNFLISRQSTVMPSHTNNNYETLGDSTECLSPINIAATSNDSGISNRSSLIVETNEFDQLLEHIQAVVDDSVPTKIHNNHHQNLSHTSMKTITNNGHSQLLIPHTALNQETSIDQSDRKQWKSFNNKRKVFLSSRSQSFDEANLKSFFKIAESDGN